MSRRDGRAAFASPRSSGDAPASLLAAERLTFISCRSRRRHPAHRVYRMIACPDEGGAASIGRRDRCGGSGLGEAFLRLGSRRPSQCKTAAYARDCPCLATNCPSFGARRKGRRSPASRPVAVRDPVEDPGLARASTRRPSIIGRFSARRVVPKTSHSGNGARAWIQARRRPRGFPVSRPCLSSERWTRRPNNYSDSPHDRHSESAVSVGALALRGGWRQSRAACREWG